MMKQLNNPTQEDYFDIWLEQLVELGYVDLILSNEAITPFKIFDQVSRTTRTSRTVYKGTKREEIKYDVSKEILLKGVTYKPDRLIVWNPRAKGLFYETMEKPKKTYFYGHYDATYDADISYVDVKAPPGYGNRNSSDEGFRYAQKWMYDKFKLYINKCVLLPNSSKKKVSTKTYLFLDTFLPDRLFFTDKTLKPRKITQNVRSIRKFLSLRS